MKQLAFFGECMLELSGTPLGTLQQGYGGDTFNTAVYLTRCAQGSARVHYATAVGDDRLSAELVQRWAGEGLALDLVRTVPGHLPGLYQIEVDAQGERRFHFWRQHSAARAYFDVPLTPLEDSPRRWDAFYFSGISLAILDDPVRKRLLAWVQHVRALGTRIVFDTNYRPRLWGSVTQARSAFADALALADVALITADDHQALHGLASLDAAVAHAQQLSVGELVIKQGAAPTLVRTPQTEGWIEIAPRAVAQVVDTTAAGDAFGAAYLLWRLQGHDPQAAARAGNALAARVIQHPGAVIPVEAMTGWEDA